VQVDNAMLDWRMKETQRADLVKSALAALKPRHKSMVAKTPAPIVVATTKNASSVPAAPSTGAEGRSSGAGDETKSSGSVAGKKLTIAEKRAAKKASVAAAGTTGTAGTAGTTSTAGKDGTSAALPARPMLRRGASLSGAKTSSSGKKTKTTTTLDPPSKRPQPLRRAQSVSALGRGARSASLPRGAAAAGTTSPATAKGLPLERSSSLPRAKPQGAVLADDETF